MEILAKDLTEKQQDRFAQAFYSITALDDSQTSCPWGCPWEHGGDISLSGIDIEDCAKNYFASIEHEIEWEEGEAKYHALLEAQENGI